MSGLTENPRLRRWPLGWRAGDIRTVVLFLVLMAFCGVLFLSFVKIILGRQDLGLSRALGDFFALWSYGRIAGAHPAVDLYSFSRLHAEQVALGMVPSAKNPFPYPPSAILVFLPLSLLPCTAAYVAWMGSSFAVYAWSVVATCWRSPAALLLALLAPATAINMDFGQSGFLSAALLIGGIRLTPARPLLAGCLLGLLTFKPQLGLLVPVALIAAGRWRTGFAAGVTAACMAALATALFGWAVWPAWIHMLPAYARLFAASHTAPRLMPTVEANIRSLGLSLGIAELVQGAVALVVAAIVWRLFRKGPTDEACAALLAGTLLCTPHALVYDAPMVTGAIALLIGSRMAADATFSLMEIVSFVLAAGFPLLGPWKGPDLPVGSLCLALLFGVTVARGLLAHRGARRAGRMRPAFAAARWSAVAEHQVR